MGDAIVAVFADHRGAEAAVKKLAAAGFEMKNLSIVGKGYHSEEKVVRFYSVGDRIKFWGGRGAFWGGLWGLFFGGLFMAIPVVGHIVVLGYLAATVLSGVETAVAFRSGQLLESDVLSPQDESLGTVHDIVMSSKDGKIAHLVIARGGLFGIHEKFVPVPWDDFKATPNASVLVLNTTKAVLEAAPQVSDDKFAAKGQFDQESQKVDAYWKLQLASKGSN